MAAYHIDVNNPNVVLIPCSFVPSGATPGKTLCVDEQGRSMVVEPDGSQTRWIDAGADGWDSPWTQADALSGFLVYRSTSVNPPNSGTPRAYRMIV